MKLPDKARNKLERVDRELLQRYESGQRNVVDEKDLVRPPREDRHVKAGLLLSDRIEFYCKRVDLIFPFSANQLRPASYTLHAGRKYVVSNKAGEVRCGDLAEEFSVIIPPSGLIYIQFFEEVNLPHYLIARFNLRVEQVYRGLLLGTGPQVDPGFRGFLGCPLHNLTDTEKAIEFFDKLATIDFEKTTPFGEKNVLDLDDDELNKIAPGIRKGDPKAAGLDDLKCKVFQGKGANWPFDFLPPGESIASSVFAMQQKVERFETRLDRYRTVGIVGLLAVLITGANMFLDVYRDVIQRLASLEIQINRPTKQPEVLPQANTPIGKTAPVQKDKTEQKGQLKAPVGGNVKEK